MPRKPRIDVPGYYHVINRGVNRENIFLCDDDKYHFLDFLNTCREIYHLKIHSFCVLDNHYHLLIETTQSNLSLGVRYLNSQYAIYFNKKMNRVGHLWQGRFKSWYINDNDYLWLAIRYIEMNPIKAGLVSLVGDYLFSSSHFLIHSVNSALLADSLLYDKDLQSWLLPLGEHDLTRLDGYKRSRYEKNNETYKTIQRRGIAQYFVAGDDIEARNEALYSAFIDGHKQSALAVYLNLSAVAVSRIIERERGKRSLFKKIKNKGLFWSYATDIEYDSKKKNLLVETVLKYADLNDIKLVCELFGIRSIKRVWDDCLRNDARFKKLNYFLARVFFNMDVEADEFIEGRYVRTEKLRLLAG